MPAGWSVAGDRLPAIAGLDVVKDLGELRDDVVELLDVIGLGEISLGAILQTFGDVLVIAGGAPDDLSDGIVAAVFLEDLQDFGSGLHGHFIIENEDGRQVGCRAAFEIAGDLQSVFEEFKRNAGMAFKDVMGQHFLVIVIVIRERYIGSVSHWSIGVSL